MRKSIIINWLLIMNKKLLLMAVASLMTLGAGAQEKGPERVQHSRPLTLIQPQVLTREMKTDAPSANALPPRRSAGSLNIYYRRPAGAFHSPFLVVDGVGLYNDGSNTYMLMKPYSDYTYQGFVDGADENDILLWNYEEYGTGGKPLSVVENSEKGDYDSPLFSVLQNGDMGQMYSFRYPYAIHSYNPFDGSIVNGHEGATIVAETDFGAYYGDEKVDLQLSSKTMCPGGRYNDRQSGMISRYYGADPWGDNEYGWWFGKNASHVDGIAQCFEKPEHPYLLKNVYLQAAYNNASMVGMVVNAPVTLTCKVYKLDGIPAYQVNGSATLPVVPGELIVTGEAVVTPTTGEANNGLITFTLYDHDELDPDLTFEYCPMIDDPIMICIDGYNDEGMEDLVEFSAFVSTDDQVDEGYGELAYLKQGVFEYEFDENGDTAYDDAGNPIRHFTGEYYWKGLNNYFGGGTTTMKTGLSIFIGVEQPYLVFADDREDGEFAFPEDIAFEYNESEVPSIEIYFLSSSPSSDDEWSMTCSGGDLPEWLGIELVDGDETGQFDDLVTAIVTAQPLPRSVFFRKAVVRFAIYGDYKDCTFIQRRTIITVPCDVNGDGEVNIADVNCLIDIILGYKDADEFDGRADIDLDQEVNIADVNRVIDVILGNLVEDDW